MSAGRLEFPSVDAIPPGAWRWPHFDPRTEWACKGTGQIVIVPDFLDRLEELRLRVGFPLPVNSGYRSPEHNLAVASSGDDGPHTTGRAADIRVHGTKALAVMAAALQLGFTGFGAQQQGPAHRRYLHLDDLTSDGPRVRPAFWTYNFDGKKAA